MPEVRGVEHDHGEAVTPADDGEPARLSTPEEKELYEWGMKARSNALHTLQESLRQLVTLATAFTAGSAALFTQMPLHFAAKATVGLSLLAALVSALVGWMPSWKVIDPSYPERVKAVRESLLRRKTLAFFWSVGLLILALLVLMAAALFWPATPWPTSN